MSIWRKSVAFLFSTYNYGKTRTNLKFKRHHRVHHTITVQDSLTVGTGIRKSVFFLVSGIHIRSLLDYFKFQTGLRTLKKILRNFFARSK